MKITGVELRRVGLPLVAPFETSFGSQTDRDILLLRVVTTEGDGWGECVALGVDVDHDFLDEITTATEWIPFP